MSNQEKIEELEVELEEIMNMYEFMPEEEVDPQVARVEALIAALGEAK